MKDLVAIARHAKELPEKEQEGEIAKAIFDELRQISYEEFKVCFSSAALDRKNKEYIITLKFKM